MSFLKAWHLPPGFSLLPEEVALAERPEGPAVHYASLSPPRMMELLRTLRTEREASLLSVPLGRIVEAVDRVAQRLLDPRDVLRGTALEGLISHSGMSPPMAEAVLLGMARGWTQESLWGLVRSEFRDPAVLDEFRLGPTGDRNRALGFPLTFHLGAGTVPGVATNSLIRGLLVKSAALLRPGSGDLMLPLVFARGLEEEAPDLARSLAVLYWPVGESGRTETVLRNVDLVVTYGSDETVRWVRERLPSHTPLRAYRHRMGFGLVGKGALDGDSTAAAELAARATAQDAARSVALFDQKGCVSPHLFLVEGGGRVEPEQWAAFLGEALDEMERSLPSGEVSGEEGIAAQQFRGVAEIKEGLGEGVVHHGGERALWTVFFHPGGPIEPSCLNRSVTVLPIGELPEAVKILEPWSSYLQTVGVAGLDGSGSEVFESLARLGVSRICNLADVPWPEPWWHHDGFGPLQDLIRWTDVEQVGPVSSSTAES